MRRLIPVAILLLAAFWRFHHLETQSLWHDEGNSLRLAERSLSDLVEATSRDIHPPGYYIALKSWMGLMGTTEFGLRSLSAFWSIVAVAATYALGRRLFGDFAATLAALLVAANPFAIYYAQETRMYAQLGALSILSLWLLLRLLDTSHARRRLYWAGGLATVNILGLYTQYTYPLTMIVQGTYFVWWWLHHRQHGLVYVGLNLVTITAFLPWLPTAYDQVTTWPSTGNTTVLADRLERIATILVYGHTTTEIDLLRILLPSVLIIAAFSSLVSGGRDISRPYTESIRQRGRGGLQRPRFLTTQRNFDRWNIALALLLCLLSIGTLLGSGAYREANLKFLLPAQSAMALIIGLGGAQISRLRSGIILQGTAIALGAVVFILTMRGIDLLDSDPTYARSDYKGIVQTINANPRADDAIILNAPNQQEVFSYYYDGPTDVYTLPEGLGGDDPATQISTERIINQHGRIFLVLWGQQERDPNGIVEATLAQNAYSVDRDWYNDVELVQYVVLEPPPPEPELVLNVSFGEDIILRGYTLSGDTFMAGQGDVVGMTLYWETGAVLARRYKVSVQVLYDYGGLASQHDSEPANGQQPTTLWEAGEVIVDNHGLILNDNLPPGTYQLIVVMYDATDPKTRLQPANDDPDQILHLETITLR